MPPEIFRLVEPSRNAVESPWRWPVAILMVRGMRDARAALRVRNALLNIPGVVWVEAVLDPGFVRVAHDPERVDPMTLPSLLAMRETTYPARFLLLIRIPHAEDDLQTTRLGVCQGFADT